MWSCGSRVNGTQWVLPASRSSTRNPKNIYTNHEAQVFHWFNQPSVPLLTWHQPETTFAPLGPSHARNSEICQGTSLPWPPKPPFLKASKLQHSSTISFRIGHFPNSIPTLRPPCTSGTKKTSARLTSFPTLYFPFPT